MPELEWISWISSACKISILQAVIATKSQRASLANLRLQGVNSSSELTPKMSRKLCGYEGHLGLDH